MYVNFKSSIRYKKTYFSEKKCLKVGFGMVFSKLKVQFLRSVETLGAAIIAHSTKGSDVTYVHITHTNTFPILHRLQSDSLFIAIVINDKKR